MMEWLSLNWQNLLAGGAVAAAIVFIIIKLIRDKKSGKGGCAHCSGGCGHCGGSCGHRREK
jgi:hypothetical protein